MTWTFFACKDASVCLLWHSSLTHSLTPLRDVAKRRSKVHFFVFCQVNNAISFPVHVSPYNGRMNEKKSTHRLFLCWPVSRCAFVREGVNPDLPIRLGGDWSAQLGRCRRGVRRGVEAIRPDCGGKDFKQKTRTERRGCCMGTEWYGVHILAFCACAVQRARRWRAGLT